MTKMLRATYIYEKPGKPKKRTTFADVAEGIRSGGIPFYIENGRLLIDDEEADAYFVKKIEAKVSALKSPGYNDEQKATNLFGEKVA